MEDSICVQLYPTISTRLPKVYRETFEIVIQQHPTSLRQTFFRGY